MLFPEMSLKDIKLYDIVITESGDDYIVLGDDKSEILMGYEDNILLNTYNEDFTHKSDADNNIVEIRRPDHWDEMIFRNWDFIEPIWARTVKMTSRELYNEFGYWVEVVDEVEE